MVTGVSCPGTISPCMSVDEKQVEDSPKAGSRLVLTKAALKWCRRCSEQGMLCGDVGRSC
ncbi:hypothetical protein ACLOJK_025764 [Asimina triloba]